MEEMLDIYNFDGKHLGILSREECHTKNAGVYHKPVWVWVKNSNGEILLQKRAKSKREAGKWDLAVAGHVVAGETILEACIRETREELGVKTVSSDFVFLKEIIRKDHWELVQVYLLILNKGIDELTPDSSEIEDLKWVKYSEFKKLVESSEFSKESYVYRDWLLDVLR